MGFSLSQSSIQDFEDCPRRFQLRYRDHQVWPAVQVEPLVEHERHLERGTQFHRLIERHQLGIPEEVLTATIDDAALQSWWAAYLADPALQELSGERLPEYTLATALEDVRLAAKYDLLVVEPELRLTIYDWKTYTRAPGRRWLENRVQTRVYPFVAMASQRFPWLTPENIKLVYWIPAAPQQPVEFAYSATAYEQDRAYLAHIIARLATYPDQETWPLTSDEGRCRYCVYRSLCGRGTAAGSFEAASQPTAELFAVEDGDWEQESVVGWDAVEDIGF